MAKTRETLNSVRMEARLISEEKLKELFYVYGCLWMGNPDNSLAYKKAQVYGNEYSRRKSTNVLLK